MYNIKKLSNGIPVIMENIPTVKSVSMGIYVKTGSKFETNEEHGVSHLLEHMIFKGTDKRSSKDISEEIDFIGGNINAYTSKEMTSFYITVLDSYIDVACDVLADIFLNSLFNKDELEKEKNVVIEEIRMYEDMPEDQVHDMNLQNVFKGCRLENSVLGTEESVKSISREVLVNYYNERYTADNIVIAIAGNINFEKISDLLETKFGGLKRKLIQREYNGKMILNQGKNIIKRDTNQIHLCMNTKGVSYHDAHKYHVSLIAEVLGGGMSSRLFQEIREERGLAYSVYSYLSSYQDGGLFTTYAGTTKEHYEEVIELVKKEFKNIRVNGITEKELHRTKNQFVSGIILGLESSKSRMSRMGNSFANYGKVVPIEDITAKIEKITLDDIKKYSEEILDEKYYSITVLGDI